MNKEAKPSRKTFSFMIAGLLLIVFNGKSVLSSAGDQVIQIPIPSTPTPGSDGPTSTPWGPTPVPLCTSWNLSSEFRRSPDQENPNRNLCNHPGVWGFMGSTGLARDAQSYYLLSPFNPNGVGVSGFNMWGPAAAPYDAFNASGGTLYVFGVWPADTFRAHPGSAQLAIIAWHSPISGYVSVSGAVSDGDPGGGDGILWYIDRNSTNVASGGFSNGGLQTFASGINGAGLNTLAVVAGDTIYLAIHPNGNYYFDSTRVDIVISRTTAPTPTTIITYTPSRTPTVSRTPTKTQTPTRTLTPTSTATSTPTPQIRWHTGNRKPIAYGVRANISAPSQAPYLEHSGESNWVSLGVPHLWVQTGWRYYKWYDTSEKSYSAWSYIEYDDPVVGKQDDDMIIHNWGDTQEYRVEWSGTMWCVFIGNVYYGCFDTTALPPIEVQAISEVHISPLNELDVNFSEVYYKSLNNTWVLFNQAVWKEDAPYVVDKIHTYEYHNYGP